MRKAVITLSLLALVGTVAGAGVAIHTFGCPFGCCMSAKSECCDEASPCCPSDCCTPDCCTESAPCCESGCPASTSAKGADGSATGEECCPNGAPCCDAAKKKN
jgi:hypothetical protein